MNLPQYLWQRLNDPSLDAITPSAIQLLIREYKSAPILDIPPCAADGYFSEQALQGLLILYDWIRETLAVEGHVVDIDTIALALLLPFVGRFAAFSETSVAARTRQGGLIILRGWQEDLVVYLNAIRARTELAQRYERRSRHITLLGDSRSYDFSQIEFGSILTSPPFPNTQDYFTMFEPEHQFLAWLSQHRALDIGITQSPLIGQTRVKGSRDVGAGIQLACVTRFFTEVDRLALTDRQKYDEQVYYRRYHQLYFHGIYNALMNVWRSAPNGAKGFIFVVDNTHRGVRVPVAEFIAESVGAVGAKAVVRSLGEQFHVGTKNPRARGVRAKHERFVIEVIK
jgi:hypothetical protein